MGEISVLVRLMGFCKIDMFAFSLYSLYIEFVSISKFLASFQSTQ